MIRHDLNVDRCQDRYQFTGKMLDISLFFYSILKPILASLIPANMEEHAHPRKMERDISVTVERAGQAKTAINLRVRSICHYIM